MTVITDKEWKKCHKSDMKPCIYKFSILRVTDLKFTGWTVNLAKMVIDTFEKKITLLVSILEIHDKIGLT